MLLKILVLNHFIKERKRKFYFLNNVGLMIIPFHFLKLVHVLNITKNIIITNKLVRLDGLRNIVLT